MAAAAFRSATRRDAFEDAGSATCGRAAAANVTRGSRGIRRSRSLSRFSPPSPSPEDAVTPSSRFVNKVRGGGGGGGGRLPEVSLDNLADEFFWARAESEDNDEDMVARGEEARDQMRFPAAVERGGGRRSSTAWYAVHEGGRVFAAAWAVDVAAAGRAARRSPRCGRFF